ncbi:MAG: hypothetical protein V7641_1070 [Blastocatellia bacterium]
MTKCLTALTAMRLWGNSAIAAGLLVERGERSPLW